MRVAAVAGVALVVVAAVFLQPPIPQDPAYHHFADQRAFLGVPNFANVVSNLGFALVGLLGLRVLTRPRRGGFGDPAERRAYVVFFLGVVLTSLGSANYHLVPDNGRLVWDRLPMTLAFMGLFSAVIAERIDVRSGVRLLLPLLGVGLVSVLYWHVTELRGVGDLRLYLLVQFAPMLLIPIMLGLYPARYTRGGDLLTALALYGAAKVLELLDAAIFQVGELVSGHTLKHVVSAVTAYWILRMLARRTVVSPTGSG